VRAACGKSIAASTSLAPEKIYRIPVILQGRPLARL
jgi:hypothetical protein